MQGGLIPKSTICACLVCKMVGHFLTFLCHKLLPAGGAKAVTFEPRRNILYGYQLPIGKSIY